MAKFRSACPSDRHVYVCAYISVGYENQCDERSKVCIGPCLHESLPCPIFDMIRLATYLCVSATRAHFFNLRLPNYTHDCD